MNDKIESPKKEAEKQLIKNIKEKGLPPLEEAALIRNARKIIKRYSTQHDMWELALKKLNKSI